MNLTSERYSHVPETPDRNSCRRNSFTSPKEEVNDLGLENSSRLICANLNVNYLRNKFKLLSYVIKNNIDILKRNLTHPFLTDSIDLTEMEMVVGLYLSTSIYQQN